MLINSSGVYEFLSNIVWLNMYIIHVHVFGGTLIKTELQREGPPQKWTKQFRFSLTSIVFVSI